jgi:hypothetical protein
VQQHLKNTLATCAALQNENAHLKLAKSELESRYKELEYVHSIVFTRFAFYSLYRGRWTQLLETIRTTPAVLSPMPSHATLGFIPATQEQLSDPNWRKNVVFWTQKDFMTRTKVEENVEYGTAGVLFVRDAAGNAPSADRAKALHSTLKSYFRSLQDPPQPTWLSATASQVEELRKVMYKEFPELAWCESHWKLKKIAVEDYLKWKDRPKLESVKVEKVDQPANNPSSSFPSPSPSFASPSFPSPPFPPPLHSTQPKSKRKREQPALGDHGGKKRQTNSEG